MNAVPMMDDLIKEYLLFRGFTTTLRAFEAELKQDRDKGFQVDKIIDQLFAYIHSYDIVALKSFWAHLDTRFFSRLDQSFFVSVRKLDVCLYRYYVIHALQNGRPDKVVEFYDKFSPELLAQPDWRDWFALPFVKNPETTPAYEGFFTKQWLEVFTLSLQNFLSTIFQSMPLPTLLTFSTERIHRKSLERELDQMRTAAHLRKEFEFAVTSDYLQPTLSAAQADKKGGFKTPSNANTPSLSRSSGRAPVDDSPRRDILAAMWDSGIPSRDDTTSLASVASSARTETDSGIAPTPSLSSSSSSSSSSAKKTQQQQHHHHYHHDAAAAAAPQEVVYELQDISLKNKPSRQASVEVFDDVGSKLAEEGMISGPGDLGSLTEASDAREGKELLILSQDCYREHKAAVTHCKFSSEGTTIASADRSGILKLWSSGSSSPSSAFLLTTSATVPCASDILSLEWESKGDRLLLLGMADGNVKFFNTDTRKSMFDLLVDQSNPRVVDLACSPVGSTFVCSSSSTSNPQEGRLMLWNMKTMKQDRLFSVDPAQPKVNSARFNHNGTMLVTGAVDGVVRVFDMSTFACIMSWKAHEGEVYSVQFSFDETSVFSLGSDSAFRQWSVHSGMKQFETSVSTFSRDSEFLPTAGRFVMDPEGEFFAVGHPQENSLIYKMGATEPLLSLSGHSKPVVSIDWCGSSNVCITGSLDSTIRLYQICRE